MNKKTIVFIHGLHENAHSWANWKVYFENLGYHCYTPNYPFHEGEPNVLRALPNEKLRKVRFKDVVAHHIQYIEQLENKSPILIGHSMGGLLVQKLIQAGNGSLGICITSAAPKGVSSWRWSFIKSNIATVNPFKGNSLYLGTKDWFHYAICNTLTRQQSDDFYEKAVIPEGRNIPRSSRFADGKIDFSKPHKPLLFVSAEHDHIIPISLNIKNMKAYTSENSIRAYKEFKGRSHSICFQQGWQEVAEYIYNWIIENSKAQPLV